ncbi:MAG: hypothetical protein PVH92_07790 [Anaerolineales bacterium]|jgi:hypothetical protein
MMTEHVEETEPRGAKRRAYRILGLTHGLESPSGLMLNDDRFFEPGEIFSAWTNWDRLEAIPFQPDMDVNIRLTDQVSRPFSITHEKKLLEIQADLKALEGTIQDRRWAILGNQGLWFRFALAIQEQHGIYALHAASIYDPRDDHLVVLIGKAGSGKSVFLLSAIQSGWQVFSTELTYFTAGGAFLRGSSFDNLYVGTLTQDFPEIRHQLDVDLPEVDEPWAHKLSVDLSNMACTERELQSPTLSLLFPHVEKGLDCAIVDEIEDPRILCRRLYESASEKISGGYLLHEQVPGPIMDTPQLAKARLQAVERLTDQKTIQLKTARIVSTGPTHCMEGLLP